MENQISDDIKGERMSRLLELQNAISLEKNMAYIDTVQKVLVDSISKRGSSVTYSARTLTNKLVHFDSQEDAVGSFRYVKINRAGAFDLFGEEVERKI
jgi:tRNA-2-methylthio-N6-dimethylallyladenosine synthase